jgi:hypothetical protein
MREQWIVVWRQSQRWCEDCSLRGAETDIARRFVPEMDRFAPTCHPLRYQEQFSLSSDFGLPRRDPVRGYNLSHGCAGCNGTGRAGVRYLFEAEGMFSTLTDKQRIVMAYRYGFADGKRWKQTELAARLGISQPAVHKHERLAKEKFRRKLVGVHGYISHTHESTSFSPLDDSRLRGNVYTSDIQQLKKDIQATRRLVEDIHWRAFTPHPSEPEYVEDAETTETD